MLQFSGGKDSIACLYLLEPRWDEITVAWCNTGAAFPETIALMADVKARVPHFLEIKGTQTIDEKGYPADVLPIPATVYGQQFEGTTGRRFQSRYDCCAASLWKPMLDAMRGVTRIIRGEKKCDSKRMGLKSGTCINGVTYEFPLSDWTDEDVCRYLAEKKIPLPANYQMMKTSLDCWNCTAYLDENAGKLDYMDVHHPEKAAHVRGVLLDLMRQIHRDTQPLREIVL